MLGGSGRSEVERSGGCPPRPIGSGCGPQRRRQLNPNSPSHPSLTASRTSSKTLSEFAKVPKNGMSASTAARMAPQMATPGSTNAQWALARIALSPTALTICNHAATGHIVLAAAERKWRAAQLTNSSTLETWPIQGLSRTAQKPTMPSSGTTSRAILRPCIASSSPAICR